MTQDIDKLVTDLKRHRDAHAIGYPTPRRDVAEAIEKAADTIASLRAELEAVKAKKISLRYDALPKWIHRAEAAESRLAQLEAENGRLLALVHEARSHFIVERRDDGHIEGIGHDSMALPKIVEALDAALTGREG